MNHPFAPSALDTKLCAKCHRPMAHHQFAMQCEVCGNTAMKYKNSVLVIDENELDTMSDGRILGCASCRERESNHVSSIPTPELVTHTAIAPEAIQSMNEARERSIESVNLKFAREIDSSIQRITDLFNAKTVAIIELKKTIDEDDSIPKDKKHETLFILLGERIDKIKPLMKNARETLINLGNEQQSIQSYMASMANRIRKEVRDKFNIADITYVPVAPPKAVKAAKPKLNEEELKFEAKRVVESGIAATEGQAISLLRMICEQRKLSPNRAANELCRTTKEVESQ